ncbi:peptidase S8/S53 domain-containing protein [Ephemerocybe angulata]|uniref:Peptidase S8/S53 domain-containing protein n=1 Tax=Ephemerocybe angulata TaxID=980116 RepID=A0A8H6HZA0_9AGAR|nr:peptidase S8/S53 domain-containing protein [Tulosesus angulatus]
MVALVAGPGWPETPTPFSLPSFHLCNMRLLWRPIALAALVVRAQPRRPAAREYDTHSYYVVEHNSQTGVSIDDVAKSIGVEIVEPLGELDDHWVVRTPTSGDLEARGFDPVIDAYHSLRDAALSDDRLQARSEEDVEFSKRLYHSIAFLERQELQHLEKRAPPPIHPPPKAAVVKKQFHIDDPMFPKQWHIVNDEYPEHMMNVTGLWAEGITGKGVLAGLIDDVDLAANFDAKNSYDFNDHQALPTPKKEFDSHGTRCAGQIAAVKNKACGVGIAYDAKVAGIRILSGRITLADEAIALNYGFQDVSLYSSVLNGINKGRGGKGSVFVFAAGNGGWSGDQCNFDGYTNSIYSVTVGAVDQKGLHPKYSEACAAVMVVAYTSGSGKSIVTTDRGKNQCADTHGGTSAAAPNVAGVFVLALQVRPDLTWRDMQYLCVETARQINPHDPDWSRMASGKYFSNKYGFGVLDGWAYVQAAKTWKLVKPQAWVETPTVRLRDGSMDNHGKYQGGEFIDDGGVSSEIRITKEMLAENNFERLEHVTVRVWIDHTKRGDVEVYIESPNGIRSVLASRREADTSENGFTGWEFMTLKHWGEDPVGSWTLHVSDQEHEDESGYLVGWNMALWGECIDPSKAKQYVIDKDDDILLPESAVTPPRPVLPETVGSPSRQ